MKRLLIFIICAFLLILITGCLGTKKELSTEYVADISQIAIGNTFDVIQQVFGENVEISKFTYEKKSDDFDIVYVDGKDNPTYYAYTDHITGTVEHVAKGYDAFTLSSEQKQIAEDYNIKLQEGDFKLSDQRDSIVNTCTPIAIELVEREFANGRTVLETQNGFIMTDSEIEPTQRVGISLHMSEGDCYTITIIWPQLEVVEFSFYPQGWHSCVQG